MATAQNHPLSSPLGTLASIVLTALLFGIGGYYLGQETNSSPSPSQTDQMPPAPTQPTPTATTEAPKWTTAQLHYLPVSFEYPTSWGEITENQAAAPSGGQQITLSFSKRSHVRAGATTATSNQPADELIYLASMNFSNGTCTIRTETINCKGIKTNGGQAAYLGQIGAESPQLLGAVPLTDGASSYRYLTFVSDSASTVDRLIFERILSSVQVKQPTSLLPSPPIPEPLGEQLLIPDEI